MNKRLFYTVMGVALSFIIAISGWALTSMLIDKKSDTLLSATGFVHINTPSIPNDKDITPDTSGENKEKQKLTDGEILSVLQNWDTPGREQPHEPVDWQIDMEQAIGVGKDGLSYFYEKGVIPNPLHDYAKINAYLCQNYPNGTSTQTLEPYYSYWVISFVSENINATLTINAVTGQIWKADIIILRPDTNLSDMYVNSTLNTFISYLDLISDEKTNLFSEQDEISAFQSFADSTFYAIVKMKAGALDSTAAYIEIKMFLSAKESSGSIRVQ